MPETTPDAPRRPRREWPINMTQAAHIASIPSWKGTDREIAAEYGISEGLVRDIRTAKSFNGVNLA